MFITSINIPHLTPSVTCGIIHTTGLENNILIKIEGNPKDPNSRGRICAKGLAGIQYLYNPDRLLVPLKRIGERGEDKWKQISWDEALSEIAARLAEIRQSHPEAFVFMSGEEGIDLITARFLRAFSAAGESPTVLDGRALYRANQETALKLTRTYGTNPWAEIPDEACLRPGCHEQRLLAGREVFQNVLFDHRPHLTEMRREKRLRCTSCHSQIVQGQHITVTESTCFLCHFKEAPLNEGTARCTLCHEIPEKLITTAGLAFDHSDVKRFGMECTLCHSTVVRGEGEVLQERCYTCHSEPERLARISETEFMHRTHVTEHKVDCLNCHIEIQHQIPKELEVIATRCEACHVGEGHSPQRDLYVGIGGKGVEPRPAAMYSGGVSCESCHLISKEGLASEVSCMSCHWAKFLKSFPTGKRL